MPGILAPIYQEFAFGNKVLPILVDETQSVNIDYEDDFIKLEYVFAKYRNKFLGFVFQSFNLINYKNAVENVSLPLYYQGIGRQERQHKAMKYLQKFGLGNWSKHLPSELSGGQKQRVAIARAMVTEPKVLLADEPTGALDSKTSHEVMNLIQEINNSGKTILVVTHEEDIAKMCKRIVRLKDGIIVEDKKIKQNLIKSNVSLLGIMVFLHVK